MAKDRGGDRRKGGKSRDDRRRVPKKKTSVLTTDNVQWVDYKDVNLLRRFMSERAKIRARRVTGNSAQQQRAVARAIRVAREMALLPYSVRQVTQRTKGGRGRDRERELPRDAIATPGPATPPPPAPDGETDELTGPPADTEAAGTSEAELAAATPVTDEAAPTTDEAAPTIDEVETE
jgi:small subunit ribosomal protein S18